MNKIQTGHFKQRDNLEFFKYAIKVILKNLGKILH